MQDQKGNISREMETLGNNPKKTLKVKNTVTEMKAFDASSVDSTQVRKRSVNSYAGLLRDPGGNDTQEQRANSAL